MLMALATVLSPIAKGSCYSLVLDMVKLTWAAAAGEYVVNWSVAGPSRHWRNDFIAGRNAGSLGSAAGLMDSGGLGGTLPCASAKRSRIPPEVFDDRSRAGCKLSPRERAIITEVNETAFAL